MTREQLIERGKNAQFLLDTPQFTATTDALKKHYFDLLCATAPELGDQREHFHKMIYLWDDMDKFLKKWSAAAQDELDRDKRVVPTA